MSDQWDTENQPHETSVEAKFDHGKPRVTLVPPKALGVIRRAMPEPFCKVAFGLDVYMEKKSVAALMDALDALIDAYGAHEVLMGIAAVREHGTAKYGDPENWRKVEPERYLNAAWRHMKEGDDESGLPHWAHLATNLAFLLELAEIS